MIKYSKYLISLFLVFSLMVNDGTIDSQSNSVDYYQYSNVILSRELNYTDSKVYVFNQFSSSKKASFLILLTFLEFAAVYSLQIRVLQKLRTLLYQKVSSFVAQHLFVNEVIASKNSCESLYIA
ncbi:hypothetical protein FNW52_01130 [Flavobacterium sp. ZT3R18]|uniref:hypothetical protein n=1 Tax=Flavobacterium sp. ZT3R18 TaxID=2594429 RepID=UPI00117AFE47|nr:hypothetical protein [Flavobacterium sp. ZT3R18]TRX38680.1 hypothetical protein FNW52_01130 [Flavobacterium sp. ZT3R18]